MVSGAIGGSAWLPLNRPSPANDAVQVVPAARDFCSLNFSLLPAGLVAAWLNCSDTRLAPQHMRRAHLRCCIGDGPYAAIAARWLNLFRKWVELNFYLGNSIVGISIRLFVLYSFIRIFAASFI